MWSAPSPTQKTTGRCLSARWTPTALNHDQPSIFTALHSLHTAPAGSPCVDLSTHLLVHEFIHMSGYLDFYMSIHLPACLSSAIRHYTEYIYLGIYIYTLLMLSQPEWVSKDLAMFYLPHLGPARQVEDSPFFLLREGPRETHAACYSSTACTLAELQHALVQTEWQAITCLRLPTLRATARGERGSRIERPDHLS